MHISGLTRTGRRRARTFPVGFLILLVGLCLTSPLPAADNVGNVPNPGTDLWSAVRQREGAVEGVTQVKGVDTGVLINVRGEWWQETRMEEVIPYGAIVLGVVAGTVLVWFLLRGPLRIEGGRTGRYLPRFDIAQRVAHWFFVFLFILLGLTGLILLFGRDALIPLLGAPAFGVVASAAKEAHNLFGPIFPFALIALFVTLRKGNGFKKYDVQWLARGGGMLGGHAPAGRYNAGEKIWFWLAMLLGGALAVTGLILDFPIFGQSRIWMEWSSLIHAIAALAMVAGLFGHAYLGTIGMEGALEAMTDGRVDVNWAKAHHDKWYEAVKDQEVEAGPVEDKALDEAAPKEQQA